MFKYQKTKKELQHFGKYMKQCDFSNIRMDPMRIGFRLDHGTFIVQKYEKVRFELHHIENRRHEQHRFVIMGQV